MVAAHTSAGKTVGLFVRPEELYTLIVCDSNICSTGCV